MPSATRKLGNVAGRPTGSHAGRPRPRPHAGFPGLPSGQPHDRGWRWPVPTLGSRTGAAVPNQSPNRAASAPPPSWRAWRVGPGRPRSLRPAHLPRAAASAAAPSAAACPLPAAPWPCPLRSLASSAPACPPAATRSPACGVLRTARPAPATPTPPVASPAPLCPAPGCLAPPLDRPAGGAGLRPRTEGAAVPNPHGSQLGLCLGPQPPPRRPRPRPAPHQTRPGIWTRTGAGALPPGARRSCTPLWAARPLKPLHTPSHSTN